MARRGSGASRWGRVGGTARDRPRRAGPPRLAPPRQRSASSRVGALDRGPTLAANGAFEGARRKAGRYAVPVARVAVVAGVSARRAGSGVWAAKKDWTSAWT